MRCTIFGGGGFIGSAIVERLLAAGHAVRVFERPRVQPYREFAAAEAVQWQTGDLMSTHDVEAAVDGADAVIHLVCTTLPKSSNEDPSFDVRSNLLPTLGLLDAMVRRGVGRIVFISSGGTVYGPAQYLPIDELHPTRPQVSYGIVKLAIEHYLHLSAALRRRVVATVTVAAPLTSEQRARLAATLTAQAGRVVNLHIVVDAHVVGGIKVELGDEVIDGTVAGRLADARRHLA